MDGASSSTYGFDQFDNLPPYPGVQPPAASGIAAPGTAAVLDRPAGGAEATRRRWFHGSLAAGAVVLAAGAFFLGRGTAHHATTSVPTATALSALSSATTPSPAACGATRRVVAGTLKSANGGTLTVTSASGGTTTVKTTSSTKVTEVVKGSISDVTTGAVVAVHGTTGGTTTGGTATGGTTTGGTAIAADQVAILPSGTASALGPARGFGFGVRPSRPATNTPGSSGGGTTAPPKVGSIAVGTVKTVSGSSFTISFGNTTVTVTTTSSTAFSKIVQGTIASLKTGEPIAAAGTTNSDGSITALNIEQTDTAATGPLGRLGGLGRIGFGFKNGRPFGKGRGPGPGPGTTVPPASSGAG